MKRLLAQVMLLADYDNVGLSDRLKYKRDENNSRVKYLGFKLKYN